MCYEIKHLRLLRGRSHAPAGRPSQRSLTLDLRALEEAGLVKRTVYPTAPIKVEYELTQDGERLKPVVGVMKEFGLWVKGKAPA